MFFQTRIKFAESPDVSAAERVSAGARTTWVSVMANLGLSCMQALAGLASGSQGLIADAVHSLSDLISDIVVLLANRESSKDPDEDHPYGHQRFETAASLILGTLLLGVGVLMALAAINRLRDPSSVRQVQRLALWIALVAIAAKEGLFRYMLAVGLRVKSSLLVANAWHARSDAASSLVVAVGIVGNLAGVPLLDPIAALIVGGLVCKIGWHFARDALHDLTDRAVDLGEIQAIRHTLLETGGVRGVHDLRTRKMGDLILVDAHLEVDGQLTVEAAHEICVDARERVLARHPVLDLMTHLDPWHRPDRDHVPRTRVLRNAANPSPVAGKPAVKPPVIRV